MNMQQPPFDPKQPFGKKPAPDLSALVEQAETTRAAEAIPFPVTKTVMKGLAQEQAKMDQESKKLTGKAKRRQEKKARREGMGQWAEVNALSLSCYQMLVMPARLTPMLKCIELLKHVPNKVLLRRLINSMTDDTRKLAEDYEKIRNLHKDRDGKISSETDVMIVYSVFTDYVNFAELCDACLVPTITQVSEMLGEAMVELKKVNPELAAQLEYNTINFELLRASKAIKGITGAGESAEETQQREEAAQAEQLKETENV